MSPTFPQAEGLTSLGSAKIRLRSDIQWIAYPDTGRWVALDPIANAFYYFNALEHQAALLLDGRRTVHQVYESIKRTCLNPQLSASWFETFIQKLFHSQLLETPEGFQASRLPAGKKPTSPLKSLLANPLSIRIPFLRPSIDHGWARCAANIAFSGFAMSFLVTGLLLVSYLVASRLLSRPHELLYDVSKMQGDRWLAFAAVLVAIKSIHELGHYLACVYLKVRCAEIGAMLLCFTPCLYCDTTETWRLPSRWHRAGIAAAGIYFEFWIALVGGLVFLGTQSGLLHLLGGGMWIMCTFGTLLLNANPLFRYDGYFILSDLIRAPNLGTQSSWALWESLLALLGGRKPDQQSYDLPIAWLSAYALISMLYRWMVMGSIIYFLWHFLVPSGLGIYFLAIGAAMALGIVKSGAGQARSLAAELFAPTPISPWRLLGLVGLIVSIVLGALWVPLPNRSVHRGYVEFARSQPIYAPEEGLVKHVGSWAQDPNHSIADASELIVQLDQPELMLEKIQQEHLHAQIASRVEIYKQATVADDTLAAEIPTLEELKAEALAKLQLIEQRIARLHIASSAPGRFVPKTGWNTAGYSRGEIRRVWQPMLSAADRAKRFKRGELMGWFTENNRTEAIVLVSAETMRSINRETQVWIVNDSNPSELLEGKISYFSSDPIPFFPSELQGDSTFVLQRDENGLLQSEVPLYKVRIEWMGDHQAAHRGGLCSARFELPRLTLGQRIYRFIASQFKPL